MSTSPTQRQGAAAEQRALRLLTSSGLRLLARNWVAPRGELDLIMQDQGCIVFVEVRQRHHFRITSAGATIDKRKQARIIHAAQHYLQSRSFREPPDCRFDVVTVDGAPDRGQLRWIKQAFSLS